MIDKATSCKSAVEMIPDGASLMIGGFMGVGSPHRIIDELVRQGRKDLTVIAEPEHIVPIGVIPPDAVATPFICVHHIIERSNCG